MKNQIFSPKVLHRKRIDKILSQIFEVPIFFMTASMGYGKTTAVKSFLGKKKEVQNIWIYAENEDNDIRMWKKFCSLIKYINSSLGKRLSDYGCPENNIEIHEIIEIIKNEIKQKTVLVIDDWCDKQTIYINYLIKALRLAEIPDFHIVILSRNKPIDNYLELEMKQKCIVVSQDDIAFTFEETVKFFEINKFKLTDKEKIELFEYTGGWVSATYVALLQYFNKNTFHNIPMVSELIKIDVYDKFDEITKQILLKLSMVNRFTLEQAIYITGNKKTKDVIRELLSNNCFIRYDRDLDVYTLHSILRNVLSEEIILNNIDLNYINNTCGDWYSKNHEDADAIEYYYKAKNFQRTLDLIERNHFIDLSDLDPEIIKSIFEELSMEEKINRPIVYLTYIFFKILHGNRRIGIELLYEAKSIYERDKNLENKNQILGEVAVVESFIMFNDLKKMNEYHKKAYELFNGGTSKIANYKMPFTFGSPNMLYLYHNKKGELKNLADDFVKEIDYFIHISKGGGSGSNYLIEAELCFETGDFTNAELLAYKALYKSKSKKQTSIIICSLFLLMRLCVNRNDRYEARNNFNDLIKEYENHNLPSFLNGAELAIGYVNGITGNLEEMDKWLEYRKNPNIPIETSVLNKSTIVCGLAMILKGSYEKLEILVTNMLTVYERENNILGILYSYIFDSIVKYKRYNNMEEAKKVLLKAIDLAKEDHIIMCFVELSPHIMPILKDIEKENLYVEMLLPKCEKFNIIYEKNYCNMEKIELTPREIEVMKLVEEGYKQSEISEKLNIALITVKKHISSVYLKLNVKNRTVATNILREKGII